MSGLLFARRTSAGYSWDPLTAFAPVVPPPPDTPSATIFGYNSTDAEATEKMQWWGRLPCGRTYYVNNPLPSDGSGFAAGGKEYKAAGLHMAGLQSSKRVNICFELNPDSIVDANSAKIKEVQAYVRSIPDGWHIYITNHEYNLRIQDGLYTSASFRHAMPILAKAIWDADAGRGRASYVINYGASGLGSGTANYDDIPEASEMQKDTQLWGDSYDNPRGTTINGNKYRNYGAPYGEAQSRITNDIYDLALAKGFLDNSDGGDRGWGIGEFCSPRRVAPKLATFDGTLGWGPASPYDIDGTGQAALIQGVCQAALGTADRPIPAKVILLWTTASGNNWNQSFATAGAPTWDDGTKANPGAHFQNWPINVDPSKPRAVYQHFIDISA